MFVPAMSSTDTDVSTAAGIFTPGARKGKHKSKAKAKVRAKSSMCGGKRVALSWKSFETNFYGRLAAVRGSKRGCDQCGFQCLEHAVPFLDALCAWRKEFQESSPDAQDKELLWIFTTCRSGSVSLRKKRNYLDASSVETSHSQSQSPHERKRSKTENEKDAQSSTETSEPPRGASPERLSLVEITDGNFSSKTDTVKVKARKHRVRAVSKRPSMDLLKFIQPQTHSSASSSCQDGAVCMKVATFLLGIGSSRVQRATCLHLTIGKIRC